MGLPGSKGYLKWTPPLFRTEFRKAELNAELSQLSVGQLEKEQNPRAGLSHSRLATPCFLINNKIFWYFVFRLFF